MNTGGQKFWGIAVVIASCAGVCLTAAETSSADWQFGSGVNPSPPTQQTNIAGAVSADIGLGYLASGWLANLDGFGTQTGLWDLGFQNSETPLESTVGKVFVEMPNSTVTDSDHTDLTLRVVQFVDNLIYWGGLTFSIPGAQFVGRTTVEKVTGGLPGYWYEDEFRWRLAPGPEQISLVITGANGTLLDRLRIDASNPSPAVPDILITLFERQGPSLLLEWTGGKSPYEVLGSTNLTDQAGWSRIGLPIYESHAQIPLDGTVGYVRVRGSE